MSVVSDLTFDSAPQWPHRLTATWMFPDRARFELALVGGRPADRSNEFHLGPRLFAQADANSESVELEGESRASTLGMFELRRALFLWPQGFDWVAEGALRRCDLFLEPAGDPIGSLVATLDDDGWPRSMSVRSADGSVNATLTVGAWASTDGREHPTELRLEMAGQAVWTERVAEVALNVNFRDDYFLPVDRIAGDGVGGEVRVGEITALVVRAIPLARERREWSAALEDEARLRGEVAAELAGSGRILRPTRLMQVDGQGRPTAVLLALEEFPAGPLPTGWEARPAGRAARLWFERLDRIGAPDVARLAAQVPAGGDPPPPYVRIGAEGGPSTLVQPLNGVQ
ncbi:hypothetical protein [Planctomycetes bacterium Pla133]